MRRGWTRFYLLPARVEEIGTIVVKYFFLACRVLPSFPLPTIFLRTCLYGPGLKFDDCMGPKTEKSEEEKNRGALIIILIIASIRPSALPLPYES
jgi:hypothetical protein